VLGQLSTYLASWVSTAYLQVAAALTYATHYALRNFKYLGKFEKIIENVGYCVGMCSVSINENDAKKLKTDDKNIVHVYCS
jgi:hypothetical protein